MMASMPNYPDPINQFNRLVYVSGTPPTGSYVLGSRWNNMHNGQNWDGRNCSAASGAVLIDAHTGGRIKSNPVQIRNHQSDWSGGIGWDDVNEAWADLWPGNQLILPNADWADVIAALKEGRAVGVQYDYDQVQYGYQCQKGGTFDHAGVLAGFRASDARVLYYDPLCRHATWVPQYVVRTGAEKLALAQRGTKSKLFVALTKVMPPPPSGVTFRYGGVPKNQGRYLARRDNVPVHSRPDPTSGRVAELDHRESFAARQSASSGRWLGTADGTRWVYREVMWYSGGITGTEDIR